MKKAYFLLLLLTLPLQAHTVEGDGVVLLKGIVESIEKQASYPKNTSWPWSPQETPVPAKETTTLPKTTTPAPMTGAQKIQEQLKKNKEKLADRRGAEKEMSEALLKAEKKGDLAAEYNLKMNELKKSTQDKFQKEKQAIDEGMAALKKREIEMRAQWFRDRDAFLKNEVQTYQKATFKIEETKPVARKLIEKSIQAKVSVPFKVLPNALSMEVRAQGARATCSAFASVRAMELLLSKAEGGAPDLSEQYFYWASKPGCQNQQCSQKGSWVIAGLKYSQDQKFPDIPYEKDCPYQAADDSTNDTQIPLPASCNKGYVQVSSYKNMNTLDEVLSALDSGSPVIVGLKLTPNFYDNVGHVFEADSLKGSVPMDRHAQGHALTLVGYLELPSTLIPTEGKVCFLASNSWGKGWGLGGYSCLSENWIKSHRNRNPFVAVEAIRSK